MAALLLFIIYLAFIGLGIPDSLFGAAWPSIYGEFSLPLSYGSFVTVIISAGTVLSSVTSAGLIARLGTGRVAALSTLLTAGALLGFSLSPSLGFLCLLAVPLGIGAGAIDVALNNYVALHYTASHMSFLHCFYGIGVSVSPYILSRVMGGPAGWRGGYRIAFLLQSAIAAVLIFSQPLWKKVHGGEAAAAETQDGTLPLPRVLAMPGVKLMCCLFITSCAMEYTCGGWGSTFLVESRGLLPAQAARIVTVYYVGMALGRFLSGLLAARLHSWTIIKIGQAILGCGVLALLVPGPTGLCALGMFAVGLGNGPLFPNFNYLTPENFGRANSQSVIGVQMAASYLGIMLAPPLCGLLGQHLGMGVFPWYLAAFYAAMLAATVLVRRKLVKSSG
ncbi:MAG: MFS transporter [Eubacteriales bacterium]|nr:MFS transporter [Eubacteriales bacterium]